MRPQGWCRLIRPGLPRARTRAPPQSHRPQVSKLEAAVAVGGAVAVRYCGTRIRSYVVAGAARVMMAEEASSVAVAMEPAMREAARVAGTPGVWGAAVMVPGMAMAAVAAARRGWRSL